MATYAAVDFALAQQKIVAGTDLSAYPVSTLRYLGRRGLTSVSASGFKAAKAFSYAGTSYPIDAAVSGLPSGVMTQLLRAGYVVGNSVVLAEVNVLRVLPYLNGAPWSGTTSIELTNGDKTGGPSYYDLGVGAVTLEYDLLQQQAITKIRLETYPDGRVYNGIKWEISVDRVNWTTVRAAAAGSTPNNTSYIETTVNQTARYVKLSMAGSVANNHNELVEVEVFATVAGSEVNLLRPAQTIGGTPLNESRFYDGDPTFASYANLGTGTVTWVIDMAQAMTVTKIQVVTYPDGRVYRQIKLEISLDNTNWTTVRAAADGSTNDATGIETAVAQSARYIRYSATGSVLNNLNEMAEIRAFVMLPT